MTKCLLLVAVGCLAPMMSTAAPAQSPRGARVEAIIGYDGFKEASISPAFIGDTNPAGAFFGLGAGYDVAIGPVSIGVDAEATESSSATELSTPSTTAISKVGMDYYFGGRLGYAISPAANVYLKGGFSSVDVDRSVESGGPLLPGEFSDSSGDGGFRLGAGGQHSLGGKSYVGAEYRMTNYDGGNGRSYGYGDTRHQFALMLGTRF